ncbi:MULTISPECIES: sugar transferase [unclassified Blastococcus]
MSLTTHDRPRPAADSPLKSLVDRLGAVVLLALITPCLVLIAAALWLTGDGRVLDREPRIGRGGREFALLRFRTTVDGFPATAAAGIRTSLRRAKLDELPQLLNVVGGQLSFVGPRPVVATGGQPRPPGDLKPGIIGLSGPGGFRLPHSRVVSVERYARDWSLRLDAAILWCALRRGLHRPRH